MIDVPADFFVERADFRLDHEAIDRLRVEVFEHEQGVPAEMLWDDADVHAVLVLARDLEHRPIGTGRLTVDGRIGRMAVDKAWRNRGVGAAMLGMLLDTARQRRLAEVTLHAQVHAVPFYLAHGFESVGELFKEAGIDHQTMRLGLPPVTEDERPQPKLVQSEEIELQTLSDCQRAALQIFQAARRKLWIFTRDLDSELIRGGDIEAALRKIATAGREAEIQILLQDVEAAQHVPALLLTLAQRLPSLVQIRQPDDESELHYPGAFLLNDTGGWMARPLASRFEGEARMHAPGTHRQWLDRFQRAWDRSRPVSELRVQGV